MAKQIQLIPKNIVFPVARILDKEDRELYQEVERKTKEKFGNSQAYKTILNGIHTENVTGSQFFWNTNLNQYLPKGQNVISLEDMETINNQDESFFKGFYTDTPEIILRTATLSWENNKYILKDLIKQINSETNKGAKYEFSSENPLRISGLELIKDRNSRNKYGLLLKIGDNTKVTNDSRFAYSNHGKQIPFGEKTKTIYTKENDLSRVFLYRDDDLYSRSDFLADSDDNGRVVVKDAEGVAPENLLNKLNDKYKSLRNEIEEKKKNLISEIQKL